MHADVLFITSNFYRAASNADAV